jgi:hypothetical protein
VDHALWITWYDLPDEGLEAYLAWPHGKHLPALACEVRGGTPEAFADLLRRETEKWAKAIRAAGIKPQ